MRKAASLLANWIEADIEVAQLAAAAEPPSSQQHLLNESLRQVISKEKQGGDAAKLLGIAQGILSGSYLLLSEPEAAEWLKAVILLSMEEETSEVKDCAATVAGLLLNRIRKKFADEPEAITELIQKAFERANSARQASVLSAMLKRLEATTLRIRSRSSRQYNIPPLDIANSARNVRADIGGDWYQDPWGWPEVEWLGTAHPEKVVERLKNPFSGWTLPIDVSKHDQSVRPGLQINPLDRVALQSLADELSLEAAGGLPNWVYGWRLSRTSEAKGVYEPNKREWKLFSRRVFKLCQIFPFTAHLDIQSFFFTIDTSRLLSQLGRKYRNSAVLDRLEFYFHTWHSRQNGLGIPQRSLASSVFAHAVLLPLDTFLNQLSNGGRSNTFTASRWMDDIWLHSNNENELRACVTEIEGLLAQLGLSLNSTKTELFESKDAAKYAQLVDVYEAVENDVPKLSLRELVEFTPSFKIGLEVSKILATKNFTLLEDIPSERWLEFSHLGTRLAKMFRISGDWKRFTDTYFDFVRRHVSSENLSVASWAEMFPHTAEPGVKRVEEFFSRHILDKSKRLLTPLAAQRLAAWSPSFGTGALGDVDLNDAVDEEYGVFRLRGIAYAALQIDATKKKTIAAIKESGDALTIDFLEDRSFVAPSLSSRFGSE